MTVDNHMETNSVRHKQYNIYIYHKKLYKTETKDASELENSPKQKPDEPNSRD